MQQQNTMKLTQQYTSLIIGKKTTQKWRTRWGRRSKGGVEQTDSRVLADSAHTAPLPGLCLVPSSSGPGEQCEAQVHARQTHPSHCCTSYARPRVKPQSVTDAEERGSLLGRLCPGNTSSLPTVGSGSDIQWAPPVCRCCLGGGHLERGA